MPGRDGHGPSRPFRPSGFFVLRSPLLPFAFLGGLGDGLRALSACADADALSAALVADRATVGERLAAAVADPVIREALFLASPSLVDGLARADPADRRARKAELALLRYLARMTGRPTPFGLMAGHAVGALDGRTRLELPPRAQNRRHTTIGIGHLVELAEAVSHDPPVRETLVLRPAPTLHRASRDRLHHVRARRAGVRRIHELVSTRAGEALEAALGAAADGAREAEVAAAVAATGVHEDRAAAYVRSLVDRGVLVGDLAPPATGPAPLDWLIERLDGVAPAREARAALVALRDELTALDAGGPGADPWRCRMLMERVAALPGADGAARRPITVEMSKPASGLSLNRTVVDEIARAVELLARIAPGAGGPAHVLAELRTQFLERFGDREVPLLEVFDEETGGLAPGPLLGFDEATAEELGRGHPPSRRARETVLVRLLADAARTGAHEVVLTTADVEALSGPGPGRLPDAFAALATVAALSSEAIDAGDFTVLVEGALAPSGARLLGRLCGGDPELRQLVESHLREEEALDPEAVHAEIACLPQSWLGTALHRPLLRDYEIDYLGPSGAPPERRIAVTDLRLSVVADRFVLRSERLDRRVEPRLSSALALDQELPPLLRFLALLQFAHSAEMLRWNWGALRVADFMPRVRVGRAVLARAMWWLRSTELPDGDEATWFAAVQRIRAERRLPRFVGLVDFDRVLPIDLDNVLSVESLVRAVRDEQEGAILVELWPAPDLLPVRGPEGGFVHQLVVPFVARAPARPAPASRSRPSDSVSATRRFAPGSEWLYLKLYAGPATAERLLCDALGPECARLVEEGVADRWFFLRYREGDGGHLRLRLHGAPEALLSTALPALRRSIAGELEDGAVRRLVLDTYEREVERYGGAEAIAIAERLFHADSEGAVEALWAIRAEPERADLRWQLALLGADALLADLDLGLEARRRVLDAGRGARFAELGFTEADGRRYAARFREQRRGLEELLAGGAPPPGADAFARRSERWRADLDALRELEDRGRLTVTRADVALSLLHLQVNRLLRPGSAQVEAMVCDFLGRLYASRGARAARL